VFSSNEGELDGSGAVYSYPLDPVVLDGSGAVYPLEPVLPECPPPVEGAGC